MEYGVHRTVVDMKGLVTISFFFFHFYRFSGGTAELRTPYNVRSIRGVNC